MVLLWVLFGLHLAGFSIPSVIVWLGAVMSFIDWAFEQK